MSGTPDAVPALHVLTITPFFPSTQNEVSGCFVAESIEQFHQFGIDSTVIAVSPVYHPGKHSSPSSLVAAEWVRYPQVPGTLGLSSAGKFLYASLIRRVERLHRITPIDVIHAHAALPCGHAAMLLSRRLNIPFVVTVHGLDVFNTCSLGGIPVNWRREVSQEVYGASRNVICISGKVQEILKVGMQSQVASSIVYNGVNPDLFSPDPDGEDLAIRKLTSVEILVVGTLLPSKGHELVLRAIAEIKDRFPELKCRIIGEGPDRSRFELLAKQLGVEQQVEFAGRQSRAEVAEAMRRCSVFVLPSWNEALGCVYLEAMSCGKPVIGCRGQGIDEVIEHKKNGWLISPEGLEELVLGLSELLRSSELRAQIGAAARQTILEKFTLVHQARQLAGVYKQVTAEA